MTRRKRLFRGVLIFALALVGIMLVPSIFGLGGAVIACRMWEAPEANDLGSRATAPEITKVTQAIDGYSRAEDATYFTLPEWYIVYSTDEYAAFIAQSPPSRFPYFQAASQFWKAWYRACEATRGRYPMNSSYQFMLVFIGNNFTADTLVRGAYESTVGRFTELISSSQLTEEDVYARQVAGEYGAFMHMMPWYEFPFREKLRGLWAETGLWGPNPIRKWERKMMLSVDYGIKAVYGPLISRITGFLYGGSDATEIYAVVEGAGELISTGKPGIKLVRHLPAGQDVVLLDRFEKFTQTVPGLIQDGLRFVELAGNDEIMVTVIAPSQPVNSFPYAVALFALPIPTRPDLARVGLRVRVADLHLLLEELEEMDIQLEHIYDY